MRRRAGQSASARPAVVWGRATEADAVDVDTVASDIASGHSTPGESTSGQSTSGQSTSGQSTAAASVVPDPVSLDAVTLDAVTLDTLTVPVAVPAVTTATDDAISAPSHTGVPLSRRARRAPVQATTVPEAVPDAQAETATSVDARISTPSPEPAIAADAFTVAGASSTEVPAPAKAMSDTLDADALASSAMPFELLEPDFASSTDDLPDAATTTFSDVRVDEPDASHVDEFERAARLFAFTGETPVQSPAAQATANHTAKRPHRKVRGAAFRRMATASFSVGVMGLVGLLAVGMTTPAAAVAAASGTITPASVVAPAGDVAGAGGQIQAYVAPAEAQSAAIQRDDNFETGTLVEMAGVAGISNPSSSVFTNNPNCPIQWPFAVGVGMSYGFGMRDGTMHEGIDFTPGDGAHIQAIDHGVVRISTDSGGNYGVTIVIDHIVDGALVSSRYAHMQYGSRQVQVGDTVEVGEYIGRTGDTGYSFGAHTHFEILAGGTTAIDPLPWLKQHATC
ncbi:peptidoglycan DD-metalloendopeptidase family protein [Microbacterium rhizomatis]|uniref:Peptidoglycan DD-metalloendopeptidase family protein n=2 Tax=Microbacterium rhizomatis TaxID=1631477 RepID=A0A5J5J5G8_9MICO|nr:peptidoglycan DD-metalloendopeptidase family protein [Microbacterium rhizomatis]